MNSEERDDLWDLLGKAKPPKVSPFFARNVIRGIRESAPAPEGAFAWFFVHWKLAAVTVAVVAVVTGLSLRPQVEADPMLALASEVSASPDYQVISHLDELLDSEQNSVWLEASAF